jgi:pyridoxamine 5'-phosphate oxidase
VRDPRWAVYDESMTRKDLIPASPAEADYLKATEGPPISETADPFVLFGDWLHEAQAKEPNDANAMALATVDADGLPDARMVLLKGFDERGFVFYTNLESAKGLELAGTPKAALLFHWKSLRRQVRIRGLVERVDDEEADAYFATRARSSQIGAWASDQSRPMKDRHALEKRIAEFGLKFGLSAPPRPAHWSGFRVAPQQFEFWRDRPFRLHERLQFTPAGAGWATARLYP